MKCLVVLLSSVLFGTSTPYSDGLRHERVVFHENPQTEAFVAWTVDTLSKDAKIYYDTQPRQTLDSYEVTTRVSRQGRLGRAFFEIWNPYFQHVRMKNLSPGTEYFFRIVTKHSVSPELSFKTAPAQAPTKLLFGGDSRSNQENRRQMNSIMARLMEDDSEIVALVHGGDYVRIGSRWSQWERWLTDHSSLARVNNRLIPIIPARGNHENSATMYNKIFAYPGNGKGYFRSEFAGARLLTLNTQTSLWGRQRRWLKEQLVTLQNKDIFVLANYHKPAFPAVKTPSQALKAWVPLFEEFGVDLVFESDGHVYKKTPPLYKGGFDRERGVYYVGEGGLGVKLRKPHQGRWYLDEAEGGLALDVHHVQKLSILEDMLLFEAVDREGLVFDELEISLDRSSLR